MKKFLIVFGGICAVLLLVVVVAAAIFIPRAMKLDREATAYVQEVVPKIVAKWESQELVDRATPELMASAKSRDELDRLFVMFQKLGAFQRLDVPRGRVSSNAYAGSGTSTLGDYVARAQFDKGPATIQIQLRRVDGAWKINGFRINSDVFLPTKE